MRNMIVTSFVAAPLLAFAMAMPSFAADPAPTACKDGTTTTSTGKGTCSGHGGVQKAAKAAPAAAAACGSRSTRRSCGRRIENLRRRHDLELDRQRHLQRSWRSAKGGESQAGHCGCDGHARHTGSCCSGSRGASRRACSVHDRRQVIDSDQVSADHGRQQHRPDRCDGEVQGRHLFQVHAPQRHLLQSRRRCRVVDCGQVGGIGLT